MAAASGVAAYGGSRKEIRMTANFALANTNSLVEHAAVNITAATGVEKGDRIVDARPTDPSLLTNFVLVRWAITANGVFDLYFRNLNAAAQAIAATDWLIIVEKAPPAY